MDDPGRVGGVVRRGAVSSLAACFDQFQHSAFRCEALPSYAVSGEGGLRSLRDNRYLRRVAAAAVAGKAWTRVRVVDDPLTGYQREQIGRVYVESHACGEDVYLLPRSALSVTPPDFWLFDAGRPGAVAVLLRFDEHGAPVGDEVVTDPARVDTLAVLADDLVALSVPFGGFVAAVDA